MESEEGMVFCFWLQWLDFYLIVLLNTSYYDSDYILPVKTSSKWHIRQWDVKLWTYNSRQNTINHNITIHSIIAALFLYALTDFSLFLVLFSGQYAKQMLLLCQDLKQRCFLSFKRSFQMMSQVDIYFQGFLLSLAGVQHYLHLMYCYFALFQSSCHMFFKFYHCCWKFDKMKFLNLTWSCSHFFCLQCSGKELVKATTLQWFVPK